MESLLSRKLGISDIKKIVDWAQEYTFFSDNKDLLWKYVQSPDRRVSTNVLWVMTHLPKSDIGWLEIHQNEIADMLLAETDASKKRLLLQLLKVQDFDPETLRSDLLDFCLSKINAECEPYAVRCFGLYVAFRMCRHFPELIAELEQYLDLLSTQQLSPGLQSALRQIRAKIKRIKNKR